MPDPIPHDKLVKILEAGRLAPSAANIQPWHFIVVTDRQKHAYLSKGGMFASFLSDSPTVIVDCGNRKASPRWYIVDTTIAMQNMVLAATAEGLGTCWVGSFDEGEAKKLLRIPEAFEIVALLALGISRERRDLAAAILHYVRRRKQLKEIASMEEFGNPLAQLLDSDLGANRASNPS